MPQEITINDILQIEAHAQAMLDAAQKMRAKLQKKETKRDAHKEAIHAYVVAHHQKLMLRRKIRMKEKKNAGL